MQPVNEKVWQTASGEDLIRCSGGRFMVIPYLCDTKKLRELAEAIADALAQEGREP